jgi:uncharacterized membrane protein YidH (DUF202 family)
MRSTCAVIAVNVAIGGVALFFEQLATASAAMHTHATREVTGCLACPR